MAPASDVRAAGDVYAPPEASGLLPDLDVLGGRTWRLSKGPKFAWGPPQSFARTGGSARFDFTSKYGTQRTLAQTIGASVSEAAPEIRESTPQRPAATRETAAKLAHDRSSATDAARARPNHL